MTDPTWSPKEPHIHVLDQVEPHPPLVTRLLNLADSMMEVFPGIESGEYFRQVRRNITIVKGGT